MTPFGFVFFLFVCFVFFTVFSDKVTSKSSQETDQLPCAGKKVANQKV